MLRKSRTKEYIGTKIKYFLEIKNFDSIYLYTKEYNGITIYLKNNTLNERKTTIKIVNLYFDLLELDIYDLQDTLRIRFVDDKIIDKKGNMVSEVFIKT